MNIKFKGEKMKELEKSLQKIVDMFWDIERRDWEEKENPENHIFLSINNIKNWLEGQGRKQNG